jgi:hypothetical protein
MGLKLICRNRIAFLIQDLEMELFFVAGLGVVHGEGVEAEDHVAQARRPGQSHRLHPVTKKVWRLELKFGSFGWKIAI